MNEAERRELVDYRISKAKETLKEIDVHVKNQLWNTAVNRLYYACFYAVTALLINKGIKTQSHAGVRKMFGLHFIKPGLIDKGLGRVFTDLFDKRLSGDYDDFFDFKKEDVIDLLPAAKQFVHEIERLLDHS